MAWIKSLHKARVLLDHNGGLQWSLIKADIKTECCLFRTNKAQYSVVHRHFHSTLKTCILRTGSCIEDRPQLLLRARSRSQYQARRYSCLQRVGQHPVNRRVNSSFKPDTCIKRSCCCGETGDDERLDRASGDGDPSVYNPRTVDFEGQRVDPSFESSIRLGANPNEPLGAIKATKRSATVAKQSPTYLDEIYQRNLWRLARNYTYTEHYDHTLYGLDADLDRAVAQHQREAKMYNQDRHLKDEQAKQVAPNVKQSPIAIMSVNPTYELQNKPLVIEYPATVQNLRLNNTGFSWEIKIPYQISITTALYGAHLNSTFRYRLDQYHCHWGSRADEGSEHIVDDRAYAAELHFVHYNMEKYHTFSKAARHPDGLVVMSVFLDAQEGYLKHAELEKIVSNLKSVPLKGEHAIIKQAVRIENLLPTNRSYWSYQGSLTTPPYLESVTWFVLKHPIKCSISQIEKFRSLKSSLRHDGGMYIKTNHRKTQPLNGRTVVSYDEYPVMSRSSTFNQ